MKKSQLTWIKEQLLKHGEISRNTCLRNYISRLSARILDLEKDGWVFTTEKRKGDFVYKASHIPDTVRAFERMFRETIKELDNLSLFA
jgi:phage pi2 protein 07